MANMSEVAVTFTGDASGVVRAAQQASSALNGVETAAKQSGGTLSNAFGSVLSGAGMAAGMAALNGLASGLKAAADATIGFNSNLEQSTIAFTSMLGSAEAAQGFLDEMKQFAATTPFEFPDLLQAAKQMMAFGFEARDVKPLLTSVGSAAAAMGTGRSGVDSITKALGQMKAATVVQAGELNQLTEQGVPAFQILADAMGISTGEVKKLASEGKIASDVFITAFQAWADSKYGDMMAKQALTFQGALSTIKDSLTFAVANAFKPFFDLLSAGAVEFSKFVQSDTFTTWAEGVAEAMRGALAALVPFAQTVGPILQAGLAWISQHGDAILGALAGIGVALGALAAHAGLALVIGGIGAALAALLSPIGLLIAACALLGAAWATNFGNIQGIVALFASIVQQAIGGDVAGALAVLKTLISDTTGQIVPLVRGWATAFIEWVTAAVGPMLAALGSLIGSVLGWVVEQIGPMVAALLGWATAFVEWIAPMIPKALGALGGLIVRIVDWIAAEGPGILASLVEWAKQFVAWVAPAIPPLLRALADLLIALGTWIIQTALPAIAAQLLQWATAFAAWVAPAAVQLLAAAAAMLASFVAWIVGAAVQAIVSALVAWLKPFTDWVANVGSMITAWGTTASGLITTAMGLMKDAITAAMGLWATAWQLGWDALAAIGKAFWDILTPENQTKLTALGKQFSDFWLAVQEIWTVAVAEVTRIASTWWEGLKTLWATESERISAGLTTWWGTVSTLWTTKTGEVARQTGTWWQEIVTLFTTETGRILTGLSTWWQGIARQAGEMGRAVIEAIRTGLQGWHRATMEMIDGIADLVRRGHGWIRNAAQNFGTDIVNSIADGIRGAINRAVDAIIHPIQNALNRAQSMVNSFRPNIYVPGFASGGSVRGGGPIMVGERGPELFVPRSSGYIVPNHRLQTGGSGVIDYDRLAQAIAGAGGGRTYNLTVNSSAGVEPILQDFALLESMARSGA
jgi:tape measure domain-containing protein